MFQSTKSKVILILVAITILVGLIGNRFFNEEQSEPAEHQGNDKPEVKSEVAEGPQVEPLDPELLHPHTEQNLRLEIDERQQNDTYTITSIVYRARWNAAENPMRSGQKWTEISKRYKPVIGEVKLHAIMHLADYDQARGFHQIHGTRSH